MVGGDHGGGFWVEQHGSSAAFCKTKTALDVLGGQSLTTGTALLSSPTADSVEHLVR